jgi:hypothetical protein
MTLSNEKVTVIMQLSQAEAEALHRAIDRYYFQDNVYSELAQEMHEKVADALLAGGYDPQEAARLP